MTDISLRPETGKANDLMDVLARLSWYAAPLFSAGAKLYLRDTPEMRLALSASAPNSFSPQAQRQFSQLRDHIIWRNTAPQNAQLIFWKMGANGYSLDDKVAPPENHILVDDWCDADATVRWTRLLAESTNFQPPKSLPTALYERPEQTVEIVGPGPSSQHPMPPSVVHETLRIVILSAYRAKHGLEKDAPHIVIFSDQPEACGPSLASAQARKLIENAAANGAWLVTHAVLAKALSGMLPPKARARLIGLQFGGKHTVSLPLSQTDNMITDTRNVLTTLVMPVAADLGKNIAFKGFDGTLKIGGDWDHLRSDNHAKTLNLKLMHPLIGLPDDYQTRHQAMTGATLKYLSRNGWNLSALHPDGRLRAVDIEGLIDPSLTTDTLSLPVRLRQAAYLLLRRLDRHETIAAALLSVLITAILSSLSIGQSMGITLLILFVTIGFLAGTILLGGLRLRRRQDQMANDLRRDLNRQHTDAMAILSKRIDHLDSTLQKVSQADD